MVPNTLISPPSPPRKTATPQNNAEPSGDNRQLNKQTIFRDLS
ncbi:MAG: hypothetical protein V7L23_15270 [Nostoc sp.]